MSVLRRCLPFLALAALVGCDGRDEPLAGRADPTEFVLELRWLGDPPPESQQAAFTTASNIVRQIVVGPLTSVSLPDNFTNVSQCDASLTGFPDVPRTPIPGLVVYLRVVNIDGPGGTLGSAGPCLVRSEARRFLPALGVMRLDAADVSQLSANGLLTTVVLHEFLHVLGIGTIWADQALIEGAGTADARFLGSAARAACAERHGGATVCAASVPVHSSDGAGSRDTHWRESVFTNELMTPFLSSGANPLSEMTIRSLADLGYVVSTALADAYTIAGAGLVAPGEAARQRTAEVWRPRWALDDAGALIPYPHR